MVPKILTYEDRFGARTLHEHAAKCPSRVGDKTPPKTTVAVGPAAVARVNFGRWIADCPCDGCRGAELVSFDRPTFFCTACRNHHVDNQLLPVLLPAQGVRKQVEAYLRARPDVPSRNWHHSEAVAELRAENRARKIKLLKEPV